MSILVGLTGNIACGKSLVGELLKEHGIPVIDSDQIVHQLYEEDEELRKKILSGFGTLDRKQIGDEIFGDSEQAIKKRRLLESIIHPAVHEKLMHWIQENCDQPILVNLIPLLFEANLAARYDKVILVMADEEVQIARLAQRNPELSKNEIVKRIKSQIPQQEKAKKADYIIDNSGTIENTRQQLEKALQKLFSR